MKVVFTCGGSAGHVNPALAVAQQFEAHYPGCEVLFIGAERGMEQRLVEQAGYPIRTVKVSTFERAWTWRVIKHNVGSLFKIPIGRRQAANILRNFKPDLVVGTGGYASFPAVREAARMGIPTAIHESNAYPGLTTRTLSDKVDLVMVGFPEAAEYYQNAKKVVATGTGGVFPAGPGERPGRAGPDGQPATGGVLLGLSGCGPHERHDAGPAGPLGRGGPPFPLHPRRRPGL